MSTIAELLVVLDTDDKKTAEVLASQAVRQIERLGGITYVIVSDLRGENDDD
jgi:hypothetical protein